MAPPIPQATSLSTPLTPDESGESRTTRYASFLKPEIFFTPMTIVGVGAIGHNLALQLAAMGFINFDIIDMDTVTPANLGPQGYAPGYLGEPKVEACEEDIKFLLPEWNGNVFNRRVAMSDVVRRDVIFACVDSMTTRADIHQWTRRNPCLFIDARMTPLQLEIYPVTHDSDAYYHHTLFTDEEAAPLPCTAKATTFCAAMASAYMIAVLFNHLKGNLLPDPFMVNLLSFTTEPLPCHRTIKSQSTSPSPSVAPPEAPTPSISPDDSLHLSSSTSSTSTNPSPKKSPLRAAV